MSTSNHLSAWPHHTSTWHCQEPAEHHDLQLPAEHLGTNVHDKIIRLRRLCSSSNIEPSLLSRNSRHLRSVSFSENMVESSVRGSWEDNMRLQMKADELERMFAEHQMRIYVKKFESESKSEPEPEPEPEPEMEGLDVVRGENYARYMEKRDAKRRAEWGVKRDEKEVRRRKLWESVERSRAELESMIVERELKLLSIRKNELQARSSLIAKDQDDQQSNDGSVKSVTSKMLTSRSLSTTAARTSVAPEHKPSSRPQSSCSSRNAVPNPDFRKENTKPSSYLHPSSVPRSKSTSSGTNLYKEEKPPRSGSLRKSSFTPLTPLKTSTSTSTTTTTTKEPKTFLKKRNDARTWVADKRNDLREETYSQVEAPVGLPTGSTASSWFSHDGGRVRKKWGSVETPVVATDKDGGAKGFKRFLNFGKKSRGSEQSKVVDWMSVSGVPDVGYSMDFGHGMAFEEEPRNTYGMGYSIQSFDGFTEDMRMQEQVQTPRRSMPAPTNLKLKKDHLSESSPNSPRSRYLLSALRNKGVESKLR